MLNRLSTWLNRDEGASAVEYGLIVVAIAAVVVAVVFALGALVRDTYGDSCGVISSGITDGVSTTC